MIETAFPFNDLLRRKLQTGLTFASLTACVAATLFLLLFSDQVSFMIQDSSKCALTSGLLTIFNQFLLFVGVLVFAVGAVLVAFTAFLFLKQRARDFGLMRATGCPTGLVFGYFFTELLLITFVACMVGIVLGFAADYLVIDTSNFQSSLKQPNFWYAPLVFISFFVFTLVFGAKPLFDTSRRLPVNLLDTTQQFGLNSTNKFKVMPKAYLTLNFITRNLFRLQAFTQRIVVFLVIVFTLLTVSIASGVIARDTTSSWVANATGKNLFMIAHQDFSRQYLAVISKFSGIISEQQHFDYLNTKFAINSSLLETLRTLPHVIAIDPRIVTFGVIQEEGSYTFDSQTLSTIPLGDHRKAEGLIVGVEPQSVSTSWRIDGRFLSVDATFEAVVGDSVAWSLYSSNSTAKIEHADPLLEGITVQSTSFDVVGVCIDPINNGFVVYVPLESLKKLTGFYSPNVLFVTVDTAADGLTVFATIEETLSKFNADLTVVNLNTVSQVNIDFLGSLWQVTMIIPLFCLSSAVFILVAFCLISIEDQRHEYAILRAIGVKPKQVVYLLGGQNLILLLSGFIVGLSIGTIITLFILIQEPVVNIVTLFNVALWLLGALLTTILASLYPSVKFAQKPLRELMS